jgi:uncharacterized Rmd1/YagE family protein
MEKTLNPRQVYLQMHISLGLQRKHSTKAMVRVSNYCVCSGHTKKQMCVCRERERERERELQGAQESWVSPNKGSNKISSFY